MNIVMLTIEDEIYNEIKRIAKEQGTKPRLIIRSCLSDYVNRGVAVQPIEAKDIIEPTIEEEPKPVAKPRKKPKKKLPKGITSRERKDKIYYIVRITRDKKRHNCGSFGTIEEAVEALNKAKEELHIEK